jgi:hypothetical protein
MNYSGVPKSAQGQVCLLPLVSLFPRVSLSPYLSFTYSPSPIALLFLISPLSSSFYSFFAISSSYHLFFCPHTCAHTRAQIYIYAHITHSHIHTHRHRHTHTHTQEAFGVDLSEFKQIIYGTDSGSVGQLLCDPSTVRKGFLVESDGTTKTPHQLTASQQADTPICQLNCTLVHRNVHTYEHGCEQTLTHTYTHKRTFTHKHKHT